MGFMEYVLGAISALIVVVLGIFILSALASATGQNATLFIILLLGVGVAVIVGVVIAIIRS
jgi:hypothetical protein